MKTKLTFFLLLILVFTLSVKAQKIENISFQPDGDKVKIFYTLKGDYPEQTFEVKIFTSVDKFQKPLEFLDGDANKKNILPGNKEVTWDAKKEYKLFEGDISFKIVANVISNFWVSAPTKGDILKRGRNYEISWEGFKPGAAVRITAHYPNGDFKELSSNVNGKTFLWKVKGKVGKGIYLKVAEADNQKHYAKSGTFTVKRKIPLAAQGGVFAAITGAVMYLVFKPVEEDALPLPPGPSK